MLGGDGNNNILHGVYDCLFVPIGIRAVAIHIALQIAGPYEFLSRRPSANRGRGRGHLPRDDDGEHIQ